MMLASSATMEEMTVATSLTWEGHGEALGRERARARLAVAVCSGRGSRPAHLLQRHVRVSGDREDDAPGALDWEVEERRGDRGEGGVAGARLAKPAADACTRVEK